MSKVLHVAGEFFLANIRVRYVRSAVEDQVELVLNTFFCACHLSELEVLAVAASVGLAVLQEAFPHRVLL